MIEEMEHLKRALREVWERVACAVLDACSAALDAFTRWLRE